MFFIFQDIKPEDEHGGTPFDPRGDADCTAPQSFVCLREGVGCSTFPVFT